MKKAMICGMSAVLFLTVTVARADAAVCGKETRVTVDSLRCEDLARDTWYEINVNKMCGTHSGVQQTVLELEEKRPSLSNVRKSIFANQVAKLIYDAKGAAEIPLFSQRAGESGLIEASAIPDAAGKTIEKVRLNITPQGGDACAKEVDVSEVWETVWS